MTLFDRLFPKEELDPGPDDIKFGRYSDAYKEAAQYDLWDQSLKLFDEHRYLEAYEQFLQYLNDPAEDNVRYTRTNGTLEFEVIQGSKRIVGFGNAQELRVASNVARIKEADETLFLHLLEYNYRLRYCRVGLTEDNHITILIDTTTIDGSPYNLYFALK